MILNSVPITHYDELSFDEGDDIEIGEMNDVDDITENVVEEDGVIIE